MNSTKQTQTQSPEAMARKFTKKVKTKPSSSDKSSSQEKTGHLSAESPKKTPKKDNGENSAKAMRRSVNEWSKGLDLQPDAERKPQKLKAAEKPKSTSSPSRSNKSFSGGNKRNYRQNTPKQNQNPKNSHATLKPKGPNHRRHQRHSPPQNTQNSGRKPQPRGRAAIARVKTLHPRQKRADAPSSVQKAPKRSGVPNVAIGISAPDYSATSAPPLERNFVERSAPRAVMRSNDLMLRKNTNHRASPNQSPKIFSMYSARGKELQDAMQAGEGGLDQMVWSSKNMAGLMKPSIIPSNSFLPPFPTKTPPKSIFNFNTEAPPYSKEDEIRKQFKKEINAKANEEISEEKPTETPKEETPKEILEEILTETPEKQQKLETAVLAPESPEKDSEIPSESKSAETTAEPPKSPKSPKSPSAETDLLLERITKINQKAEKRSQSDIIGKYAENEDELNTQIDSFKKRLESCRNAKKAASAPLVFAAAPQRKMPFPRNVAGPALRSQPQFQPRRLVVNRLPFYKTQQPVFLVNNLAGAQRRSGGGEASVGRNEAASRMKAEVRKEVGEEEKAQEAQRAKVQVAVDEAVSKIAVEKSKSEPKTDSESESQPEEEISTTFSYDKILSFRRKTTEESFAEVRSRCFKDEIEPSGPVFAAIFAQKNVAVTDVGPFWNKFGSATDFAARRMRNKTYDFKPHNTNSSANFQRIPRKNVPAKTMKKPVLIQDSDKYAKLATRLNSLLNKLSADNFERIMSGIINLIKDCDSKNIKTFTILVKAIFGKAVIEQRYSDLYAQMVFRFTQKFKAYKVYDDADPNKFFDLHLPKLVMTTIKNKFIEMNAVETNDEMTIEEKNKIMDQALGNIKFAGELYLIKMIGSKLMINCIRVLTKKRAPTEKDFDVICKLLSTIGQRLDEEKAEATKEMVKTIFSKINYYIKHVATGRSKFLLMDLMDFRRSGWKSIAVAAKPNPPKTSQDARGLPQSKTRRDEWSKAGTLPTSLAKNPRRARKPGEIRNITIDDEKFGGMEWDRKISHIENFRRFTAQSEMDVDEFWEFSKAFWANESKDDVVEAFGVLFGLVIERMCDPKRKKVRFEGLLAVLVKQKVMTKATVSKAIENCLCKFSYWKEDFPKMEPEIAKAFFALIKEGVLSVRFLADEKHRKTMAPFEVKIADFLGDLMERAGQSARMEPLRKAIRNGQQNANRAM